MRAHLATIDGVFTAHDFLDKGMPGFALHRHGIIAFYQLAGIPNQPRVVHHFLTGVIEQEALSQQPHHVITFDKAAVFVEKETAVEVSVPGNPHVGFFGQHRIDGWLAVFFQQWIRHPIREIAVRLMMHFHKTEGQAALDSINDRPGATVTRIDHNLQRFEPGNVDVAHQMIKVSPLRRKSLVRARLRRRRKLTLLSAGFDIEQARITADRF